MGECAQAKLNVNPQTCQPKLEINIRILKTIEFLARKDILSGHVQSHMLQRKNTQFSEYVSFQAKHVIR